MPELVELRDASSPTMNEDFSGKVNRLHSTAYLGMACVAFPQRPTSRMQVVGHLDKSDVPTTIVLHYGCPPEERLTTTEPVALMTEGMPAAWVELLNAGVCGQSDARLHEAFNASLRNFQSSFTKLMGHVRNTPNESRDNANVWIDELDSAVRVCPQLEIAHALGTYVAEEEEWNDAKNHRRCDLVDKEIDGTITQLEASELGQLQNQMLAYRRKIAPLPLAEARELHQALLNKARKQNSQE